LILPRRFLPWLLLPLCGLLCWSIVKRSSPEAPASKAPEARHPAVAEESSRAGYKLGRDWRDLLERCQNSSDPEELRRQLAALKEEWLDEEPDVTAGIIGQLLRDGKDAETSIAFQTGPGGTLRGWPTLRVFLLDVLASTDPDLAGEIAREILASTGSAEEYAVALRPLMMGKPWQASDEELQGYLAKMLATPEWQTRVGLMEALDLTRVAAAPGTTETLAHWVDSSPPAFAAGSMALHETAAQSPALVVDLISADHSLFASQPELRASLMARAVASDSTQSGQVETYLKDPSIPATEKKEFLNLYPLRSATTGYRLYGNPPSPFEHSQVISDDRAALEAVTRWQADPALAGLLPDLRSLGGRLQSWVRQARD
jgi:hypothetical protein